MPVVIIPVVDGERIGCPPSSVRTSRLPAVAVSVDTVFPNTAEHEGMREFLETDTGFYYAIGVFTIAVFLIGLVALAVFTSGGVGTRELAGLVVGFFIFMLVYFVSVTVHRLEERDDV